MLKTLAAASTLDKDLKAKGASTREGAAAERRRAITERIAGQQLDPFARELILRVHNLR